MTRRDTSIFLQSIDILCKYEMKQVLLREKGKECMRERGAQIAGFAGSGNPVEWLGGVFEEVYVEDCFGVGEF